MRIGLTRSASGWTWEAAGVFPAWSWPSWRKSTVQPSEPFRIEAIPPLGADVVSARALAPLEKLLGYVARHCRPGGTALLLKGAQVHSELSDARKYWHFQSEESPSVTDPQAVVLKLKELRGV